MIYERGRHLGLVTKTICIHFDPSDGLLVYLYESNTGDVAI